MTICLSPPEGCGQNCPVACSESQPPCGQHMRPATETIIEDQKRVYEHIQP